MCLYAKNLLLRLMPQLYHPGKGQDRSFYLFSPMYFFLECSNSYLCHILKHSIISNILPTIYIFNTSNTVIQ